MANDEPFHACPAGVEPAYLQMTFFWTVHKVLGASRKARRAVRRERKAAAKARKRTPEIGSWFSCELQLPGCQTGKTCPISSGDIFSSCYILYWVKFARLVCQEKADSKRKPCDKCSRRVDLSEPWFKHILGAGAHWPAAPCWSKCWRCKFPSFPETCRPLGRALRGPLWCPSQAGSRFFENAKKNSWPQMKPRNSRVSGTRGREPWRSVRLLWIKTLNPSEGMQQPGTERQGRRSARFFWGEKTVCRHVAIKHTRVWWNHGYSPLCLLFFLHLSLQVMHNTKDFMNIT